MLLTRLFPASPVTSKENSKTLALSAGALD
jgi:hypothetical protein